MPVSINDLESVEDTDFGSTFEYPSARPTYLGLNSSSKYFNDKRVRQAMSLGLDRQEIVDVILDGRGRPLSQTHPPQMWAYNNDIPVPEQDLEAPSWKKKHEEPILPKPEPEKGKDDGKAPGKPGVGKPGDGKPGDAVA